MSAIRAEADIERLIGVYRSIELASRDMLAAAQDSDWVRVCTIQARCGTLIDQLRALAPRVELSRDDRKAKLRIVRQIVRNEAQIRRLAYPWTERYEHLLTGRGTPPAAGRRAP